MAGFRDLLSRLPAHADARGEVDYGGGARHEMWENLDRFGVYYGIPHGCLYIVWLGKTLMDIGRGNQVHATHFESVIAIHDPGVTELD